jgi:apolipoprotein N-acyltransferase
MGGGRESTAMGPRWVYPILGFLSGFLVSLILSALLLNWPLRSLVLAVLLGLASIAEMRSAGGPRRGWALAGVWFTLGYALFAALLVWLEILFPPLT